MRPAEVGPAIVKAAEDYLADLRQRAAQDPQMQQRKGATLAELAAAAQVSHQCARDLVPKLAKRGHLQVVNTRRVAYRNRPVFEYAPAEPARDLLTDSGPMALASCLQAWAR